MQPRALKRLLQRAVSERREVLAEGLALLSDNVAALDADIDLLTKAERGRSLSILARQADEEAAKALILLDIGRMDMRDEEGIGRQITHFYNHLARCIYAEVTQMSPADFAEVRRMVDSMRPSHFLDGPEGFEWIFRNRLLAAREEGLYVDYVHEEEGDRWVSPADHDRIQFGGPSPAVRELIGSLTRLGATSAEGLDLAGEVWAEVELTDSTHWQVVVRANRAVVSGLIARGIAENQATQADVDRVIRSWTFPLSSLELTETKVRKVDLESERKRALEVLAL
jgi:AbiV family abortive infection protein